MKGAHPRAARRRAQRVAVAIDLGGTNLRMGVVTESGRVIHWERQPTPGDRKSILRSISALVGEGLEFCRQARRDVAGVGISTGGQVDVRKGVIVSATSLIPDWSHVPLRRFLERRHHIPVFADNDGNCYAAAEWRFGRGRRYRTFVGVVLGTGIGGGVYVDGKPLRGAGNFAAGIGHVTVDANGPECSCGGRGCVELYASGSGIARWASEDPLLRPLGAEAGELTSKVIGEASKAGNAAATELLKAAGERLGLAMAGVVNVINPECIILSGSLLDLGSPFLDAFTSTVKRRAMKANAAHLKFERSDFPREGGILGAAALAFQETAE